MSLNQSRGYDNLPEFSKDMYKETYFLPNENYSDWLERLTEAYCDDYEHASRIKEYIWNYWFHPSTPVSANAGLPTRGLPISCFTNEVKDNKDGIFSNYEENFRLGSSGGGIGTDWSEVRELGAKIGSSGKSSGIIPFIKVSDSSTLAVSQGGLRRASQAVYLDVSHPEIEEFIDIRRPTGDGNRRSLNIHHGVKVSDEFMKAVEQRTTFNLVSPKDNTVVKTVDAFDLWQKILVTRIETGEPYLFFKDTVSNMLPENYVKKGWDVTTSNLCSEIFLHTDAGYSGVCCLSSLNLEYFDEYKDNLYQVIKDVLLFLDNVLQSFIDNAKGNKGYENAVYSAMYERSVGLGVMGFHSYLQKKNIPWESALASGINKNIFREIGACANSASVNIGITKGPCPLSVDVGTPYRFTTKIAIAPTASISTLCNVTSQGVDPRVSNIYNHKTKVGTYIVKNKFLEKALEEKGLNTEDVWKSIKENQGSIQHLDGVDDWTKDVFRTAYEIDQHWIIEFAGDRQPFIDQGQSVNVFLPADCNVKYLYGVHMAAWKKKLKSLYYCRSTTIQRATVGNTIEREEIKYDECLACQ